MERIVCVKAFIIFVFITLSIKNVEREEWVMNATS